MPDPRHTVENIRAFLHSGDAAAGGQLQSLAADYAAMCGEANSRLRRCEDFLRDGLRGEALAHARGNPPLLPFIAALQFGEIPDWERTCAANKLPRPARLALDSANQLALAARQQEPLEELLARHRYLALARAEPAKRLDVLRQLIAADPASECWKRDAGELESARLAALRSDAAAAARKGDIVKVRRLLAELEAGPWLTAVPADLMEILSRASSSLTAEAAVASLRRLLPRVRAARAALIYQECRDVFAEWGAIVTDSRASVPADLRQEILPLAHWLDEQEERREQEQEFKSACAMLAAAVKGRAPAEQLVKLYRSAAGFDFPMSDDLVGDYKRVLEFSRREQRGEKRKQYLLAAALVGVIAMALAALGYVMFGTGAH